MVQPNPYFGAILDTAPPHALECAWGFRRTVACPIVGGGGKPLRGRGARQERTTSEMLRDLQVFMTIYTLRSKRVITDGKLPPQNAGSPLRPPPGEPPRWRIRRAARRHRLNAEVWDCKYRFRLAATMLRLRSI